MPASTRCLPQVGQVNTADTLTLDRPWRVLPDATSEYVVGQFFAENHWYGNQNNTPGRTSLWYEQIGNVISHQRDVFAGGLDIWGSDLTDRTKSADPNAPAKPETRRVAVSHTLVTDKQVSYTGRGISVSDTARKTFLLGNEFERVAQPILDWGLRTRHRGNRVYQLDEQGERSTPLCPTCSAQASSRSSSQVSSAVSRQSCGAMQRVP